VCTAVRADDAVQGGGVRWGERAAAAHVAVVLRRHVQLVRRDLRVGFVGLALVPLSPLPCRHLLQRKGVPLSTPHAHWDVRAL